MHAEAELSGSVFGEASGRIDQSTHGLSISLCNQPRIFDIYTVSQRVVWVKRVIVEDVGGLVGKVGGDK